MIIINLKHQSYSLYIKIWTTIIIILNTYNIANIINLTENMRILPTLTNF